jgi:gamma-butyrobetaine dioxygenase
MTVAEWASLHPFALRDACPCAECRHPTSGQRLFESHAVVPRAQVSSLECEGDALVVRWADGHVSVYPAGGPAAVPARPPVVTWGSELAVPAWDHRDVTSDAAIRRDWLAAVASYGVALLHGVPAVEGAVVEVAELFGHVRETNYGRSFDVRVRVDASNLADTALGLSLHTDNPYREPAPTLQLLHCLASTVSGGQTLLADGFRAVKLLQRDAPGSLALLAMVDVPFAYADHDAELVHRVPVIQLDAAGRPASLHVNNRSKGIPERDAAIVGKWYGAYFALLDLLTADDALVVLRLEPGDLIVFDNLRVLHGRGAFSSGGDRRLQGCYADRDGLFSTLAVLNRKQQA